MTHFGQVNRSVLTGILLLVLAAGGFAIACFASFEPVDGHPDPIAYIEAAENLLNGRGLVAVERLYEASPLHRFADQRFTHYPPLFPLMVAGIGACGAAPMDAAKWLNILLMGASTLLIGYGVYRATAGSVFFSVFAAALFALSPATLNAHSEAFSDPAFLFLGISGLVLLSSCLEAEQPIRLLAAAGLVALAWMTRYVGAALVPAAILAILIYAKTSFRRRIADAVIFGIVASLPIAAWFIWNQIVAGTAMHRPISYHPLAAQQLNGAFDTVLRYFLPTEAPPMARLAVAGIIATAILVVFSGIVRHSRGLPMRRFPHLPPLCGVMCLFGLAYLAVVAVSITYVDAAIPVDSRHLFPLYACLVIAAFSAAPSIRPSLGRLQLVLSCCAIFAVLALNAFADAKSAAASHNGRGATAKSWRDRGLMKWIQSLPPETPIYTNAGTAVHFWTGRRTFGLPVKFHAMSNETNVDYQKQMSALRDGLRQPGSVLVLFRSYWPAFYPSELELRRKINLDLAKVMDGPQGTVLRANQP